MERTILHVDLDAFYASVETLYNPALRGKPVAVVGDPALRHGIVLAKSYEAKRLGVQTGDAIWQAQQKCRDLTLVPANFSRYIKHSRLVKSLLAQYSDRCESFGLDESWVDLTGTGADGAAIAEEIRQRIYEECGVTASVGVSFNKVFAKLGSDMQKPNGQTVIDREHFREKVWPLPARDLLYVGKATAQKLDTYGIYTIGDLARTRVDFLEERFGKMGRTLWGFANGMDTSPVLAVDAPSQIQSIGNSTTVPYDLSADRDVRVTLYALCESVAHRLRSHERRCRTVQIWVRDYQLFSYERQVTLQHPACTSQELFEAAYALYRQHHTSGRPIRSLGVRGCNLEPMEETQLCLYPVDEQIRSREVLEGSIDQIRRRFGNEAIRRGVMFTAPLLASLRTEEDHVPFPKAGVMA